MNHNNEYHTDVNYGNRFPDDWYFINDKDSINTSFPIFLKILKSLGAKIR